MIHRVDRAELKIGDDDQLATRGLTFEPRDSASNRARRMWRFR